MIKSHFPDTFEVHKMSNKEGLLIYLKDENPIDILHTHLNYQRRVKDVTTSVSTKPTTSNTISTNDVKKIDGNNFENQLFEVVKKLNTEYIWKQCVTNSSKYTEDQKNKIVIFLIPFLCDTAINDSNLKGA